MTSRIPIFDAAYYTISGIITSVSLYQLYKTIKGQARTEDKVVDTGAWLISSLVGVMMFTVPKSSHANMKIVNTPIPVYITQ
jgi:hypothetical protein